MGQSIITSRFHQKKKKNLPTKQKRDTGSRREAHLVKTIAKRLKPCVGLPAVLIPKSRSDLVHQTCASLAGRVPRQFPHAVESVEKAPRGGVRRQNRREVRETQSRAEVDGGPEPDAEERPRCPVGQALRGERLEQRREEMEAEAAVRQRGVFEEGVAAEGLERVVFSEGEGGGAGLDGEGDDS